MFDYNKINHIEKYSILTRTNEKRKLVIWRDLPYWLLVDDNSIELISLIEGKTFSEIVEALKRCMKEQIDENQVFEFLSQLEEAEVIWQGTPVRTEKKCFYSYVIRYITLNITNTCNLFCKHCYIEASNKNKNFLSLEQVKVIVQKLKPYMVKSCYFNVSGGEALMNPECIDILRYLSEEGIENLNLVSNGTLIDDEKAEQLSKIKGLSVQISLDGASAKVHESIRGKNTYDRTINGIRNCIQKEIKVSLSPIVTQDLFEEIEEYFELGKKLGVSSIFLQPINDVGRAKKNGLERVNDADVFRKFVELYKNDPELKDMIPGSLDVQHLTSVKLLEKCLFCGSGISSLAIQPDGSCYPCPNTIMPGMEICNILEDDIGEYWFDSPILKKIRGVNVNTNLSEKCRECEFSKERLIEMLWVAATEPTLFSYDVERKQRMNDMLEIEVNEIVEKDARFTEEINGII